MAQFVTLINFSFLSELIRITQPNGIITMSARPVHYDDDLRHQIDSHAANGRIEILYRESHPYMTGQNANATYIVIRVTP